MKNNKGKKKSNFFARFLFKLFLLVVFFVASIFITRYYFYDSDTSIKRTDLTNIYIDGIKLRDNISEIDLSKYTEIDTKIEDCNYNFSELSIKTDSKGNIEYIVANLNKVVLEINGEKNLKKLSEIEEILGNNYKTALYGTDNNYRKIARYVDGQDSIYLGVVYSRYNNELLQIIISTKRIKDKT